MPARRGSPDDVAPCLAIVDSSPEFFNERGRREARGYFERCPFFVFAEEDLVLGFAVVARKNPRVAELVLAATKRS
ncbi:MAG: hypothetical protein L3K04_07360, partial [Thermoplasmata archaeon]|nr:hypothetical protein [Thermoplasmata archaeon]